MIDKDRLWSSVQTLGEIGEREDGGMMRVTGSDADRRVRDILVGWFEDAGMDVSIDPVGNIVARREGRTDLAPIATGSHVDTDRPVEIVVFTEEEGTRFGMGLLGSLVASGKLELEEALALTDENGTTIEETLQRIGYDGTATFDLADAAGFVEMHVEQGPILDRSDSSVGIVEAVAGITHHAVTFEGEADHAGNTPMDMRRDAFMGAAEFALELEDIAKPISENTVGTVGKVSVSPNGTNVIPESAALGVDIRDTDGDRLSEAISQLREKTERLTARRDLEFNWEVQLDVSPSVMNEEIKTSLIATTEECGYEYLELLSGAGHDAMNAQAVTPTGMLFVPSEDGISHSPHEFTDAIDLYRGTKVLDGTLRELAKLE